MPLIKHIYDIFTTNREEIKSIYNQIGVKVKHVPLKDLRPYNLEQKYKKEHKSLNVKALIDNIDSTDKNSDAFIAAKISWLIEQEKTIGFYSTIQGHLKFKEDNFDIFFHPGMSRIFVMIMLELWDSKVIVWDEADLLDSPVLSFDEWMNIFSEVPIKNTFCTYHKHMLEMHVGEDRDDMKHMVKLIKDKIYYNQKPIIIGNLETSLNDYFRTEGDNGVFVETKNDYEFQEKDLWSLLLLYSQNLSPIEFENYTIYHK